MADRELLLCGLSAVHVVAGGEPGAAGGDEGDPGRPRRLARPAHAPGAPHPSLLLHSQKSSLRRQVNTEKFSSKSMSQLLTWEWDQCSVSTGSTCFWASRIY